MLRALGTGSALGGPWGRPGLIDASAIGQGLLASVLGLAAMGVSILFGLGLAGDSALFWLAVPASALVGVVAIYVKLRPEWLFLGWLVAAPLLSESARQTGIGFLLYGVLYVLPLAIFGFHLMRSHPLSRPLRWFDVLPVAYVVFIVVSQAVVDGATVRQPGFYTNLVHSGVLVAVAAYYFCAFGPLERLKSRHLAAALLGSCSVVALMGVIEHYTFWNLWNQPQIDDPPRIVTTFSQPAVLGAFFGTGIVLATAILVWDGPRRLRRLSIVTIALALPALIFTYTRGAILPTVAVAAILVAAKPRTRLVGAGVAVVLAVFLTLSWSSLTGSSDYQERAPTDDYNVRSRLLIATASLELAKDRPLLGWGYRTYDDVKARINFDTGELPQSSVYGYTSHNTFLTVLVELGAVGLALLVLPWLAVVVSTMRRLRHDDHARWFVLASLGAILVIAGTALSTDMRFFSFVPALLWIYVGLLRRRLWDPSFPR